MHVASDASLAEETAAYAALEPWALADRWRIYARLREEAPVYRVGNSWLVTRHEDVLSVLNDRTHVRNGAPSRGVPREVLDRLTDGELAMLADIVDWEERWLTAANGQRHAELRAIGTRVFAPRALQEMRARIEAVTEELLDEIAGSDDVDFISSFAYRLPLTVISEILDIPEEMREPLHNTWVGMLPARTGLAWRTELPKHLEPTHEHFKAMERQIKDLLDLRAETETTQIMRNLVDARAEGADEKDLLVLIQILVTAGHQTTEDLLGNGLHALLTNPEQWQRLCDDPTLAPAVVEEVLRYRSPSQDIERFAATSFVLGGERIEADDHITVLLGSANRDGAVFANPESFDTLRDDVKAHVAFGHGPHFCLGAALSRLEAGIVFKRLAERFPSTQLLVEEPDWLANTHLLGLKSLRVSLR